jgi:hypothetical protein
MKARFVESVPILILAALLLLLSNAGLFVYLRN